MSNVQKTRARNIAAFADNTSGHISAQDGRNLILSAYDYVFNGDPTPDADIVNTFGYPNAEGFDRGTRWLNSTSGRLWESIDASAGAAVWEPIAYLSDLPAMTVVAAGANVTVSFDGMHTYTVAATGGSPPFNPGIAAGLVLWVEQDGTLYQDAAGTIPVTNGSPVGKWIDESVAHNDLVRFFADSYRPTFIAAAYGSFNAVRFTPLNELTATIAALASISESTWFVVVAYPGSGNSNTVLLGEISGDKPIGMQDGGPRWLSAWSAGNGYQDHGGSLGGVHVTARRLASGFSTIADALAGWFDGVAETLTTTGTPPPDVWGTTGEMFVGGISGGGDMHGDVLAVIIYDRALTDPEVDAVNAYLTNKYLGTTVPTSQFIGTTAPLTQSGPPWAPTINLPGVPTNIINYNSWQLGIVFPANQVSIGYPYSRLSGAPSNPVGWVKYEVPMTSLTSGNITLDTFPASKCFAAGYFAIRIQVAHSGSTGSTWAANLWLIRQDATSRFIGGLNIIQSGTDEPAAVALELADPSVILLSAPMSGSVPGQGTWSIQIRPQAVPGGIMITGGVLDVWLLLGDLP